MSRISTLDFAPDLDPELLGNQSRYLGLRCGCSPTAGSPTAAIGAASERPGEASRGRAAYSATNGLCACGSIS